MAPGQTALDFAKTMSVPKLIGAALQAADQALATLRDAATARGGGGLVLPPPAELAAGAATRSRLVVSV
eukprot:SAG11_NODE_13400_length_657_cov_0.897849_1_plen_68_part_01